MNTFRVQCLLAPVLILGLCGPVFGQSWDELTEDQQAALAPWSEQWNELDETQRKRLLEGADRWQDLNASERDRVEQRLERWQAMSPEERKRARKRLERLQSLPEDVQDRMRQGLQRLKELPPEQRRQLRERWESMSSSERRAFLAGFVVRESLQQRAWLRELRPIERRRLQRRVSKLDDRRRDILGQAMRRLDPDDRPEFARQVLRASDGELDELINRALDRAAEDGTRP